jgi:NAD(P)-dependent dehydrogenase (short-subunit alcohol dehydrogenase family)
MLITDTDVSAPDSVAEMIRKSVAKVKRNDYAVNSAGLMSIPSKSHETTMEEFDRINSVDYRGLWISAREEIRQMRTQEPLETHDGRPGNRGYAVPSPDGLNGSKIMTDCEQCYCQCGQCPRPGRSAECRILRA